MQWGVVEKDKYLSAFKEANPMFVTTIRDKFTQWALWSKRVNWYFFRELFSSNYIPKYSTHYNIVWQRSKDFNPIKPISLECKIKKISDTETQLVFENFTTKKDFVADVEVDYHVEFNKTIFPIIGNRFLINIQDLFVTNNELKTRSHYRISPYLSNTNLMLEHKSSDVKNVLKIFTSPKNRTQLNIKNCNAKIIRFYSEEQEVNRIMFQNNQNDFSSNPLTDENWQNGISLKSNAFFIATSSNVSINVGDILEFPTGKRKISNIHKNAEYTNIYVNGKKLDPIKDGYPNKIKLVKKE